MATIKKRVWTTSKGQRREGWQLRYTDAQGVERAKQFERKGDASAYLTKVNWQLSQGTHTADSASITVKQAADLWIAAATTKGRERATIKGYIEHRDLHIVPLIGATKLSQLSMPAVENYKDSLLETRSPAMAAKVLRSLTSILTVAQRKGLVAQNVARGVKVERSGRDREDVVIPSKDDVRALLVAAKAGEDENPSLYPMLLTVAFAGLRSSELRGLRKADVDLKAGELRICQRADQWGVIGPPKSKAGRRTIPIPPALVSELRKWMLRAPQGELGLMFPNSEGGARLHSNFLNREYWPLQIRAGLTRATGAPDQEGRPTMRAKYEFHAIRHYAASAWIQQRVDLKRLQVWIGHADIATTLNTYGHLLKDEEGDAAIVAAMAAELMG